jgi:hypothetical protein
LSHPCLEELHTNINITLDKKLTQKLLFVKRLEKLEKDAIRLFYAQQHDECFETLERALGLLEERSGQAPEDPRYPEHLVYIRYLQC